MNTLFEALKRGERINPNDFNRSLDGLNQYYQSKAFDIYQKTQKPISFFGNYTDPICMPNFIDFDNNIEFLEVKVFGFPSFKNHVKVNTVIDSSPFAKNITVS